jgi:hypothetical protein
MSLRNVLEASEIALDAAPASAFTARVGDLADAPSACVPTVHKTVAEANEDVRAAIDGAGAVMGALDIAQE